MTSETLKLLKLVIFFHKADSLSMFWKHFRDPKMSTLGRETLFIKSSDIQWSNINLLTRKLSSYPLIKKAIENLKLSKHGMNMGQILVRQQTVHQSTDPCWQTICPQPPPIPQNFFQRWSYKPCFWFSNLQTENNPYRQTIYPNPHPPLKIFFLKKGDPKNPFLNWNTSV